MEASENRLYDLTALEKIFKRFEGRKDDILIPLVQSIQEEYGWLPKEALRLAADHFRIPLSKIYGVVTFYSQFYLTPRGKHLVRCCRGTACHVRGSKRVIESVEQKLGLKDGQTSKDLTFSFETVACLGACALGPIMTIDDEIYGHMSPAKVSSLIDEHLRRDKDESANR